jgi:general secretion pathway protein D
MRVISSDAQVSVYHDAFHRSIGKIMKRKHLIALGLLILLVAAAVEAKTRKGDAFVKQGRVAEAKGDWDEALRLYERAVDQDPSDVGYLVVMRKARFEAGQKHVNAGQKLRAAGKLEEALQEFQKALVTDPASAIALQETKRIHDMVLGIKAGAKVEDRGLTPGELARRNSQLHVDSMLEPPLLKPMTAVIPVLKMNNQPPKVLYDTVAKLAGVNVVFDSQYAPPTRNFNVDLSNATADQAFDYLATLTHTFWKPLTSNTIFVAEDNVTKRRDYEDDVVKVFYLTNTTSVQEFQEIATAIRTVAEIRRVFTYNAQRAMIVRDTVDKVALAEKLVHDLDRPKSEVVVDVFVMQANSERTRDLAATIASAGTAGLNVPINFSPPGTTTGSTTSTTTGTTTPTTTGNTIGLNQLGKLSTSAFSTTLPGGLLQAMIADTRTKVLNNPQVRASDGQKVTLKIGNRIPYATGSFQTNTASALVSTQFNYADVGVNVDMTPQIHSADEVTLHVEVTISSVQQYVLIGGISQPVIGQQSNIADIRLREGEVNILGGLSQTSDAFSSNGIPGLVDIPVLGRILFGNDHTDKSRSELIIALVPHIVRTPDYSAENMRGIYAGTDQVVKINYAPRTAEPASSSAITPGVAVVPALSSLNVQAPAAAPVNPDRPVLLRAQPVSSALPPASSAAAPVPSNPAPSDGGPVHISFLPAAVQATAGSKVTVAVQADNAANLSAVSPLRIKYDTALLRLEDMVPGDLFSRGGVDAAAVKDIRNDTGEGTITITRPPNAAGVSGKGAIAVLTFTALGNGSSPITIIELGLKDLRAEPVAATAVTLGVRIQ